ncbi:hypothetical protein JW707_03165 [Candidatus Woesearchaeota archaeon]|nr:hypothetical protein [Candidatus Woesearchaeota archaeon]
MFGSSKAQVAMEYLIIIGFVAVITIPLVIIFQTHSQETKAEITSTQIYHVSKKIADGAETVFYLGEPSRLTIKSYFPEDIASIQLGNNEIVFRVRTRNGIDDVVVYTPINITGNLSTHQGVHYLNIECRGDYVWVSD